MNDPKWFRVMTVGLILASLAVGYFLIAGKFSKKPTVKDSTVLGQTVSPIPLSSPSTQSAYDKIVERNMNNVQVLPKTAYPVNLLMVFASGAIAAGFGLKRFPK